MKPIFKYSGGKGRELKRIKTLIPSINEFDRVVEPFAGGAAFAFDLEKPAFKLYPILRKLKFFLSNVDQVKFARMTGSGSTIVAYFLNKKSAINALKLVKKKFKNYWSILSKTI